MGHAHSIPGHDCFLAAVGNNTNLVAFPGEPFFPLRNLPLYNLNLPVAPAVITSPKTADQVSKIVRCADANGYKVQAYSGGHSYGNYGLGGADSAIVVDLKHFQQFSIDNTSHIATIGAGTLLGDVHQRLYQAVGSGGHFTIGGLGPMSRNWGTALDHIQEVEVVLANSSIVRASDMQNQDIFFAVKGAAASFGVVTEFKVHTHPAPQEAFQYSYSFSIGTAASRAQIFKDWQRLITQENLTRKFASELVIFEGGVIISGTFFGSRVEFNTFQLEKKFPLSNSGTVAYLTNWLGMLSSQAEDLMLRIAGSVSTSFYAKSMSFTPQSLIPDAGLEVMFQYLDTTPKGTLAWFVIFDLEGGATNDVPVNATAYAHREAIMWMQSYAISFSEPVSSTTKRFLNDLHGVLSAARPGADLHSYPGYVDPDLANAQKAYWGPNLARLQRIKTDVDPKDVFHNPQSVQAIPKTP
ncbi:hypothetical protein NUU61_005393 [Penicillium alfredii]|uniref:FAD-binding PCMH-type domain-containing protein n=1 Tax=Penicillium alfredii TaxID=1506179 RepID=A0A9W9F9R8_9EURO|nr:uncharacterized protein NUU61_005393 [Penicillium alfredii]KAJ5096037.1 hypothetical protein NUU61_005393 [Penicillium alfredii]